MLLDVLRIKNKISAIRGLHFTASVEAVFEGREALGARFEQELIDRHGGPAKLKELSAVYAKLGLLPPAVDLKTSLVGFLIENVAGFYSMKTKQIVLARPKGVLYSSRMKPLPSDLTETVLAHELTHALQDQNFRLSERLLNPANDDSAMALRALMEGDAILAELAYESAGTEGYSVDRLHQAIVDIVAATEPVVTFLPALLADRFRFPYESGALFVHRVLRRHGWNGVNVLYRDPPISTEQVLHPEKYFAKRDKPTGLTVDDPRGLFPQGWRELENQVLGELMIRCLLKTYLPVSEAVTAAAGWDGDRFVAYGLGSDIAFVWFTIWDSEADAREFTSAYDVARARKYVHAPGWQKRAHLERRNHTVMAIEGILSPDNADKIARIWDGLKITGSDFPARFAPPTVAVSTNAAFEPVSPPRSSLR